MFGLRAWPTPIVKPLWPFMIGSALTFAGVWKLQNVALQSEEARNDPKNPFAKTAKSGGH
ncbi:ATPase, F0 complex, subunit J [Dioszegia hungarica]|uniref:ATPase, F0 complex, subunit J n=1 Tax=Dioszegia hungarica TaxID=4972 RepID=A0AA38LRX8_9TREE|nr:ATPase, F0 complex, subunit J [Dioszegia hungarica]KAI9635037.1 ATPase, F0 complex, subunit J [Dioszegia hungarica]